MSNYLIGRDPFEIKYFNQIVFDDYASRRGSMEIFSALSGIEQALWDIWWKHTGQPVYNLKVLLEENFVFMQMDGTQVL